MNDHTSPLAPVTVIGLGKMGTALAEAFVERGHPTTVWNRTPGRARPLVAGGARKAETVTDAVAASPLVVICVLDYDVADDLIGSAGASLDGRLVVNLTNGTPDQARHTAGLVAAHGGGYVDGGIMAVPSMIGAPHAVILYSGATEAFETHRPALEVLGTATHLGADPGLAALHDLALLSAMYGMFGGFLHATALVKAVGQEAGEFTTALMIPWLHAMTTSLPRMAEQIDTGDFTAEEADLAMQAANDTIGEVSRSLGVSDELYAPMQALMERRVADGHGGDDLPGLIELLLKPGERA
ncbi:MAG TPA: NAD(P)-binding domain-containing protein [Jiangellaceae bacterium]